MNIVIGICGLGYGHCIREGQVIDELHRRGHRVITFGYLNSTHFMETHFPNVMHCDIRRLWMPPAEKGLDLAAIARDPRNAFSDGAEVNFGAMNRVLSTFGAPPDLVISDYCPVVPELAYVTCRPLVTLDSQSKFMAFKFPALDGRTRDQELCRLSLMIPHAELRISTVTFKIPWERDRRFEIEIVPPIIRPEIRRYDWRTPSRQPQDEIIVYLSRYPAVRDRDRQPLREFISVFHRYTKHRFVVYVHDDVEPTQIENVSIEAFHTESFPSRFAASAALITTAGDGILAEAMYLRKPVLVVPMKTYEQNYNASEVAIHGCGMACQELTSDSLSAFMNGMTEYSERIARIADSDVVYQGDGFQEMIRLLERKFGI